MEGLKDKKRLENLIYSKKERKKSEEMRKGGREIETERVREGEAERKKERE